MVTGFSGADARVHAPQFVYKPDIEYTRVDGVSLRMDASIPESAVAAPAAIIVHGGGWVRGDRRYDVAPLFEPLNDAGFAWFSIDYRFATDVAHFGSGIADVQAAVRYVKANAREFHVGPDRIALIGESAGGQLAAMAALKADASDSVRAVVAFYTPSDLVTLVKTSDYIPARIRQSVVGTPWERLILAGLAQLSPIENVRRNMPPFLLIHGTNDSLVPFSQSRDMCTRMRQAGANCELYSVNGAGHGLRWWESNPRFAAGYKREMIEWLRRELAVQMAANS